MAAVVTVVLWQLPAGRYLLYPLTILATWFHEMAHGLCALLLGGTFIRLQLFRDGSGYAVYSGIRFLGNLGVALVAAAGPVGPAIAGSALILASLRPKRATLALVILPLAMLLSALVWIRTPFGVGLIGLLALVLLLIRAKGSPNWHCLSLQFIGVQACISVFLQIGYLFTDHIEFQGRLVYSDTGQIARALFLPHWFWALALTGLTLWLPTVSLRRALRPIK